MLACPQCKILKLFRAFHCPMCKVCITKFTRHSLVFGSCIGSTNELLAWAFFFCLTVAEFLTIWAFFNESSYGMITNIMFYALNVYIFWISFVEMSTIFMMVIFLNDKEFLVWCDRTLGKNVDDVSILDETSWKIVREQCRKSNHWLILGASKQFYWIFLCLVQYSRLRKQDQSRGW